MKTLKNCFNNIVIRGGLILLAFILILFYVYPPLSLFLKGLSVDGLSLSDFGESFLNSIRISLGVFILTFLIGGFLAWLVVKTDFPFKNLIENLSLISFAIPPYIVALSWMQLFGRNGFFERFIHYFTLFDDFHSSPYSLWAVIIVLSLHLYPLMFMSLKNALKKVNSDLEKASLLSGASNFETFIKITLPLIMPSILSTGLFVFSRSLANFSVPALLCLPKNISVATTKIYSSLSMLDTAKASFYSLLLVLFSTFLFILQTYFLGKGKNQRHIKNLKMENKESIVYLGKFKIIFVFIVFSFFLVICIIPSFLMLISSLLLRWGLDLEINNFTLDNYKYILDFSGKPFLAFKNSFTYGIVASLFASIIGGSCAIISYFYTKKRYKIFSLIASWPMAIPNTVLAVSAIFAWNNYPLKLYGSKWGLIITYMVLFTPIIMNQVYGLLQVQDDSLFIAARLSGASIYRSFFKVVFPFLKSGFKYGIIVCIMICLREIPIALLLYSAGQETTGVLLFGMQSQSYGLEMISALAVVIVFIILTGNFFLKKKNWRKKRYE